jgi:hypothetical protein
MSTSECVNTFVTTLSPARRPSLKQARDWLAQCRVPLDDVKHCSDAATALAEALVLCWDERHARGGVHIKTRDMNDQGWPFRAKTVLQLVKLWQRHACAEVAALAQDIYACLFGSAATGAPASETGTVDEDDVDVLHCSACDRHFSAPHKLQVHMAAKHAAVKAEVVTVTRERPHVCSTCGFAFTKAAHLRRHVANKHAAAAPVAAVAKQQQQQPLDELLAAARELHQKLLPQLGALREQVARDEAALAQRKQELAALGVYVQSFQTLQA